MPSKSNKTSGNKFEDDFAGILNENGFWCHVMQQKKEGQPADIIAVRGRFHTLIDCKEISNIKDGFPFTRVEENQRLAMEKFLKCAGELGYFALKLPVEEGEDPLSNIRMISLSRIKQLMGRGHKSLTPRMFDTETWRLDAWLDSSAVWGEDK